MPALDAGRGRLKRGRQGGHNPVLLPCGAGCSGELVEQEPAGATLVHPWADPLVDKNPGPSPWLLDLGWASDVRRAAVTGLEPRAGEGTREGGWSCEARSLVLCAFAWVGGRGVRVGDANAVELAVYVWSAPSRGRLEEEKGKFPLFGEQRPVSPFLFPCSLVCGPEPESGSSVINSAPIPFPSSLPPLREREAESGVKLSRLPGDPSQFW